MSDAELIAVVRGGDTQAYGVLYERHLHAAKRAASCLAHTHAEREDLVADAFTRVLRALRDGGGPTEEFRAYLLVTLRNTAISTTRGATVSLYADLPESYLPRAVGDPVVHRWDAMAAATAFASLPERWRTVLWHTEVEDESPAEIAPLLGLRPNGVAALAYRAREGLRQAYLRAHLPEVQSQECRATVAKLAGWVRHNVPDPLHRKIARHLARCAECRDRADTLAKVNDELRVSVAPLLLGATLAAAYVPVAAPVSGAAVAKTLFAKVAVVTAIAATAVTTVASAPSGPGGGLGAPPALADPGSSTADSSIHGPAPAGTEPAASIAPADPSSARNPSAGNPSAPNPPVGTPSAAPPSSAADPPPATPPARTRVKPPAGPPAGAPATPVTDRAPVATGVPAAPGPRVPTPPRATPSTGTPGQRHADEQKPEKGR
jgi:RNA polymerase sigma factor (sigma-70 family)